MSHTVISVENLSKCYRLGAIGTRTLSGDFERWWGGQKYPQITQMTQIIFGHLRYPWTIPSPG